MIVAEGLTKRYGDKTAVDGIDFAVQPGKVTGFLGPNGAGKSTTMRMIVGLDRPTAGRVTLDGREYRAMRSPLTEVGILLDAKAVHTGRSARNHLRAMAATHGIPRSRVDEVIEITGLQSVAGKRAGGFSLGMGQRLGIAAALLGDPRILILDEPVNGLDPEGVRWVRQFVRAQAAEGRTVLLSSHLMSEMAQTADHVIVLGKGRVLADAGIDEIVRAWTSTTVAVRSPRADELGALLAGPDVTVTSVESGLLEVTGVAASTIGDTAANAGIALHELTPRSGSLEDAYLALTEGAVEYHTKEVGR
ncbi:ATP-binding cassette domain-containing protein [Microbacterium sp. EYE_5]|uniref:ABC transporter ATP-binding protein n=1 Tax=unclassified Microbacterium TaxID=2609290 RepID=UPI0020057BAE|nr:MULTISPECIES: ATP-binding cassette domain-containing protein [unclassified Microbacterium]MCK6080808.1 ATP-binding cassette domain-containing protein [Microbacterium sp. EYE_382]MCK6086079.1 ATP-binding cassette domain-containing protein [Microbacterium sp. EYE_384]MCK6124423.1 ATP-binding cassette domain-containing protein [Microbacterium sp. EYE_80]MCK6127332.1 ATP-binding cassette domain-containing protein [Microbacterium sp. EYE_79]MCK6141763.1 ATP-binding cassette domain-containing pro